MFEISKNKSSQKLFHSFFIVLDDSEIFDFSIMFLFKEMFVNILEHILSKCVYNINLKCVHNVKLKCPNDPTLWD